MVNSLSDMHKGSLLPIKNRVLSVDENTTFLAHYDLNEHDVIRGVKTFGQTTALHFNGTTYINLDNSAAILKTNDDFSVTCWFNTADTSSTVIHERTIFSVHDARGENIFRIGIGTNGSIFYSAFTNDMINGSSYNDGKWHHLAVTVGGLSGTPRVYVDGIEITGYSGAQIPWTNAALMSIGQEYDATTPTDFYRGKLMDVRIYKKILLSEEIEKHMVSLDERDLIGHWKLDEGGGNIAKDSSSFHNDGIVINPLWTSGNSVFTLYPQDGQFGGAIAVEEATVNTMTGYLSSFANLKIGESHSSVVKEGEIKVTRTGEYRFFAEYLSDVTYGILNLTNQIAWPIGSQTISAYITKYYEAPGTTGRLGIGRSSSGNPSLHGKVSLGRKEYVINDNEDKGNVRLSLRSGDVVIKAGSYIEWEFLQLEKKSFATSFVQGERPKGLLAYPKEILNTESFTFNAWVKLNAHVGGAAQPIFELSSSESQRLMISHQSSTKRLGVWNAGKQDLLSDVTPPVNEWYMVTLTFDGSMYKLYYNGVEIISGNRGAYIPQSQDKLYIGGHHVGNLNGLIDEVRIDRVARTEEEILAWYESNSPFWPRGIYRKSY